MKRVTYWNDEYGCWSYHCSSGDAAKLLAAYEVAMPLERAQELSQAEKDGRLIVLNEPMKPLIWGDDAHYTVLCPNCNHDLMGGFPEGELCRIAMYQCRYCGQPIDVTEAVTREEAEAALKKEEADNDD